MTLREFYREFRKVARGFYVAKDGIIRNRRGDCPVWAVGSCPTDKRLSIMCAADREPDPDDDERRIRRRLLQIIREEVTS